MQFQFSTASRIIFRPGAAKAIPELTAELGQRPCLVTGGNPERTSELEEALRPAATVRISGEPDTGAALDAARLARDAECDMVVAVGGGSAMDTGKVVAALISNTGDIFDYLEVVGKGLPLSEKPVPLITVPTTAGTGSEVTANGVLLVREQGVKVSLRNTAMIADVAVIDPELTLSVPPAVTAATGMDALAQLMEAYVSTRSTPMTSGLCREGLIRAATSLPIAYEDGLDLPAREDMALAALFSGIALANAGLGAVHGFAAPIGGAFAAPHGAVCGCLLPHVMRANIRALRHREPDSPALFAYNEIAVILSGDVTASAEDGADWVGELCHELEIPSLSAMGVTPDHFDQLAAKAESASSMRGNPVALSREELTGILEAAI
ncbi:iron-containing alcohol dehydrogenase [Pseudodesulfovibrio cashew]|uniref:Iron-containing alcohol dehydrogenase n=1 Tax=Pseudodesulfovibrio cashew TaxID=2678688 RepID=A0A6I6JV90_9BACT|nr:iron-containing alcohol dehydrogenase [Pseudodesulfovibrio cashew]QGY41594.1 iron-containing alcohol dehydrogenase [Pseudodesulfovibrio cashew]